MVQPRIGKVVGLGSGQLSVHQSQLIEPNSKISINRIIFHIIKKLRGEIYLMSDFYFPLLPFTYAYMSAAFSVFASVSLREIGICSGDAFSLERFLLYPLFSYIDSTGPEGWEGD